MLVRKFPFEGMKYYWKNNINMISFFSISKTFASGKTEKRIFDILKELGLPSGKVKIDF